MSGFGPHLVFDGQDGAGRPGDGLDALDDSRVFPPRTFVHLDTDREFPKRIGPDRPQVSGKLGLEVSR